MVNYCLEENLYRDVLGDPLEDAFLKIYLDLDGHKRLLEIRIHLHKGMYLWLAPLLNKQNSCSHQVGEQSSFLDILLIPRNQNHCNYFAGDYVDQGSCKNYILSYMDIHFCLSPLIYKHNNPLRLVREQYSLYQAYYSYLFS